MKVHELGHIVFYVTDIEKMVAFYEGVLGFHLIHRDVGIAVFGTPRTHHEMLLIEVGGVAKPKGLQPGLYHFGLKIGDSPEDTQKAYQELVAANVPILGASDHGVTHSLYIADPDGNEIELYSDVSDEWKTNPEAILTPIKPLHLTSR
jgi:catechol-2,3-dioxygenase